MTDLKTSGLEENRSNKMGFCCVDFWKGIRRTEDIPVQDTDGN